ncbi:hypothetical protein [Nocardia sp. CC227C]|uniref:hypothetical protein n=1 Tax=Nocardia sp. CC227C TaxID=3044562 RepID=UPI00278BC21C|nr:hypothetical protein [Nocardia sp. CC227C]
MRTVPLEFVAEVAELDRLRENAFEGLRAANARGLTGSDMDAMVTALDEVEARCEQLRKRFFPRRHKLVITCGVAMLVSKTFRSCEIVWQRTPRQRGWGDE